MALIVGGHRQRVAPTVVRRGRIRDVRGKRGADLCDRAGQRHGGRAVVGDCGIAGYCSQRSMRDRERDGHVAGSRIGVRNVQSGDDLGRVLVR